MSEPINALSWQFGVPGEVPKSDAEWLDQYRTECRRLDLLVKRKSNALAKIANHIKGDDVLAAFACIEAAATEPS